MFNKVIKYYFTMADCGLNDTAIKTALGITGTDGLGNAVVNNLMFRFVKGYIGSGDEDTAVYKNLVKADFLVKLKLKYDLLKGKYYELYKQLVTNNLDLMKGLNSETVNKYSDAPQAEGTWSIDTYMSNLNKNVSSVDTLDNVSKLKHINDEYQNIVNNFLHEFNSLFIFDWED